MIHRKYKLTIVCLILFCILFLFTGCSNEYDKTNNFQFEHFSISETYDKAGNLILKEVYNRETKITTIYQYDYEAENGFVFCKDIDIFKIDKEGNIVIVNAEEKNE